MARYDTSKIILHPYMTEKVMTSIEKENKLTFVVRKNATKPEIKKALEKMLEIKITDVTTMISSKGIKYATVKLDKEYSATDVGMRLGLF